MQAEQLAFADMWPAYFVVGETMYYLFDIGKYDEPRIGFNDLVQMSENVIYLVTQRTSGEIWYVDLANGYPKLIADYRYYYEEKQGWYYVIMGKNPLPFDPYNPLKYV